MSCGSIFRGAVLWLVADARQTGGKHPGVGWWLPSWPLWTDDGMSLEKIIALCLCFPSLTWGCLSWYLWKYFEVTKGKYYTRDSSNCCTYQSWDVLNCKPQTSLSLWHQSTNASVACIHSFFYTLPCHTFLILTQLNREDVSMLRVTDFNWFMHFVAAMLFPDYVTFC